MTVKVVDASVVAAILFAEPELERALEVLNGFDLIAPSLLPYEIANVAATKRRRAPELSDFIDGAVAKFEDLGITLVDIDPQQMFQTAAASGLSGYDAAYLWLGRHEGADVATFDRRLLAASVA